MGAFSSKRRGVIANLRPDDWRIPWLQIRNYDDLVAVNSAFVAGRIQVSPYYGAPLDEESEALKPGLQDLHRYGLVTVNSQPGLVEENQFTLRNRSHPSGWYYSSKQRSFVDFFMPKTPKRMQAVRSLFLRRSGFAVSMTDMNTRQWESNFKGRLNLTLDRGAETLEALADEPWREYTNMSSNASFWEAKAFDNYPNIVDTLGDTVCVSVASSADYGEGDAIEALLAAFAAVGLKPMYDIRQ